MSKINQTTKKIWLTVTNCICFTLDPPLFVKEEHTRAMSANAEVVLDKQIQKERELHDHVQSAPQIIHADLQRDLTHNSNPEKRRQDELLPLEQEMRDKFLALEKKFAVSTAQHSLLHAQALPWELVQLRLEKASNERIGGLLAEMVEEEEEEQRARKAKNLRYIALVKEMEDAMAGHYLYDIALAEESADKLSYMKERDDARAQLAEAQLEINSCKTANAALHRRMQDLIKQQDETKKELDKAQLDAVWWVDTAGTAHPRPKRLKFKGEA